MTKICQKLFSGAPLSIMHAQVKLQVVAVTKLKGVILTDGCIYSVEYLWL